EMDMGQMGTYRIFGVGEKRLGGMMTTPKGAQMPPMWIYYVGVSDLDAVLGRATKKGAKVMNGPMDVPGGGRIVQLLDPQGAAFALHQSPKKEGSALRLEFSGFLRRVSNGVIAAPEVRVRQLRVCVCSSWPPLALEKQRKGGCARFCSPALPPVSSRSI